MIFTKDLQSEIPLSAYNDNYLEFVPTDNEKIIINCIVSFNGFEIELTPNTNRKFTINLLTISKVITNQNNFNDLIEPNVKASIINNDNTLFNELEFTFKINFNDETFDSITRTFIFIKSVKQDIRDKSNINYLSFPLLNKFNLNYYITYFDGYPFDFSIYSNINREIEIINKINAQQKIVSFTKGVNRFFISDGLNNITNKNILPLVLGINQIEFKIEGENIYTIYITKNESDCTSAYLKFFNQSGSYSYWLLPKNKNTQLTSKTIDDLENNYKDIKNTSSNILISGKTGIETLNTTTNLLSQSEQKYLKEIFLSPKVYLLNAERFSEVLNEDWIEIKISDNTLSLPPKSNRNRFSIKLELPKLHTQTL